MTSQLTIQQNNAFSKYKPYRFWLTSSVDEVEVDMPNGWADGETTYSRHEKYKSVLRSVSSKELTFYNKGKQFLQSVYDSEGIDGNCQMTVKKFNKSTYIYDDYPAAGKIDFSLYEKDEVSVKVGAVDSNFNERILNRTTTVLDLFNTTSIDGYEVANVFTDTSINMPDTAIDSESSWGGVPVPLGTNQYIVPIALNGGGDFSEARTPSLASGNIDKKTGAYFQSSTNGRILTLSGTIDVLIVGSGGVEFELVHLNSSDVVLSRTGLGTITNPSTTLIYSKQLTLSQGDSVNLQGTADSGITVRHNGTHLINETYTGSPQQTSTAFPYYEAFLRLCQLMAGEENPFYSDYFGRTDTPLTTYGSDGNLGFITRGIFFRIGTSSTSDYPIAVTFEKLFDSLDMFNLGMGIEQQSGVDKVRIEELSHWFDTSILVDVSDRLRTEDIKVKVIPERFYKSVSLGFNKFDYEQNAGLLEFNTKSNWTTEIQSVFNELQKVSNYRGDGQGMRLLLLAPDAVDYDPSEDVKGDDDLFLVDAVRDGSVFTARTNEGFDSVGGSVYAGSSFNIWYAPGRTLRRWGGVIKSTLLNKLNSYIRWQSSDKNTTLESKLTTESYTVVENADVLANDLDSNLWINEMYTIEVPLSTTELNTIDANPNGIIQIDTDKYGWILNLKTKNKDGMSEIELLRVDTNNVTPI